MRVHQEHSQLLFNKIQQLPPEKVAVVDDFVDFLKSRNQEDTLVKAAGKLSEQSFQKAWDNPEDTEYDSL